MTPYSHHIAQWKAYKASATTPLGYVIDAWGGYYQVGTSYGPWTFRLPSPPKGE